MKGTRSNKDALWLGFFVWPLVSFIYSLRRFDIKKYRIYILLFAILAGYCLTPVPGSDGQRYQQLFTEYHSFNLEKYLSDVKSIFMASSSVTDIYSVTLLYLVSRFTSDPRIFFMVVAIIYYIVFIRLIELVKNSYPNSENKWAMLFLTGCIFIYSFTLGINGVRWALGFVLFAYGALKYLITERIGSVFISSLSVLIHFSFIYSLSFLLLFIVTKRLNSYIVLYVIFLLAILYTSLFPTVIESLLSIGGSGLQEKYLGYTNPHYINLRIEGLGATKWFVKFDRFSTFYYASVTLILSRLPFFKIGFDKLSKQLFAFSVFMLIQSLSLGTIIDPLSNRYYLLVNFFVLAYLFYLFNLNPGNKFLKAISIVYLPILLSHIIWVLRVDLDTVSPLLVLGNPFLILITNSKISFWEFFFR